MRLKEAATATFLVNVVPVGAIFGFWPAKPADDRVTSEADNQKMIQEEVLMLNSHCSSQISSRLCTLHETHHHDQKKQFSLERLLDDLYDSPDPETLEALRETAEAYARTKDNWCGTPEKEQLAFCTDTTENFLEIKDAITWWCSGDGGGTKIKAGGLCDVFLRHILAVDPRVVKDKKLGQTKVRSALINFRSYFYRILTGFLEGEGYSSKNGLHF